MTLNTRRRHESCAHERLCIKRMIDSTNHANVMILTSGVPQNVEVVPYASMPSLQRPKSVSFM